MARNGRPPLGLKLTEAEREDLLARLGAHKGAADEKFRIRIVLALAQRESSSVIANLRSDNAGQAQRDRQAFVDDGADDLKMAQALCVVSNRRIERCTAPGSGASSER